MGSSLQTIHRLREHARQESQARLRQAEELRDEQRARLDAVHEAMADARVHRDPTDALSLLTYAAFRAQQEVLARKETVRLTQRERDVNQAESLHHGRVRDELAAANLISAQDERAADEARRAETRTLDEVAARLRRVA